MTEVVLLPGSIAEAIHGAGARWGYLDLRPVPSDGVVVVVGYSLKEAVRKRGVSPWADNHYSRGASAVPASGVWYRVEPEVHVDGFRAALRGASIPIDDFRSRTEGRWIHPPVHGAFRAITVSEDKGDPDGTWCAWLLSRETATYLPIERVPEVTDILRPLVGHWPLERLDQASVTVVGVGSIGSVAAEALVSYGVRRLSLVDPDRLQGHNFARHRALRSEQGRFKVDSVADLLKARDSEVEIKALRADVIRDGDQMRPLFKGSDVVLACVDGVAPRRVASHLSYWAQTPVVLACVLEDGAIGEVLRLAPPRTGCLLCNRAELVAAGSIDPEPALDVGYGDLGQPMTAVAGDLALTGQLAAKSVVATLLERGGDPGQRLPNDHALVGLRPVPGLPEPFDLERVGDIRWRATAPRRPQCPTCGNSV